MHTGIILAYSQIESYLRTKHGTVLQVVKGVRMEIADPARTER